MNSLNVFLGDYINYKMNGAKFKRITINITAKCNLDCLFCECRSLDSKSDLTFDEIKYFFNTMRDREVKSVFIGGGEPFMRKDIWDILTFLKKRGYDISIVSNGILLADITEEKLDVLDNTVSTLSLSLDSTQADLHNYYRNSKHAYERVVKAIDKIVNLSKIKLIITMVITNDNYKEMPDIIEFAKEHRVRHVSFQPFSESTNFPDISPKEKTHFLLSPDKVDELREIHNRTKLKSNELNIGTNLHLSEGWIFDYFLNKGKGYTIFKNMVNRFDCVVPFDELYVRHNGDVQLCALLPRISSIREKNIEEVIRDVQRRRSILKKGKFPQECRRCFCGLSRNIRFSILSHPIRNYPYLRKIIFPDKVE